ncbi:hypothetical protein [Sulfuriferula plumbiphila]|nr:hypothetical protein [Sulfuriferula plumbiphila]
MVVEKATANASQRPKIDLAPLQSVIKETLQQAQAGMREASRDVLLNRNVVIVMLAGVLMCGIGVWWGGQQSDARWTPWCNNSMIGQASGCGWPSPAPAVRVKRRGEKTGCRLRGSVLNGIGFYWVLFAVQKCSCIVGWNPYKTYQPHIKSSCLMAVSGGV